MLLCLHHNIFIFYICFSVIFIHINLTPNINKFRQLAFSQNFIIHLFDRILSQTVPCLAFEFTNWKVYFAVQFRFKNIFNKRSNKRPFVISNYLHEIIFYKMWSEVSQIESTIVIWIELIWDIQNNFAWIFLHQKLLS